MTSKGLHDDESLVRMHKCPSRLLQIEGCRLLPIRRAKIEVVKVESEVDKVESEEHCLTKHHET